MAVVVVDKDNYLDQAQGKELPRVDDKELPTTPRQGRRHAEHVEPKEDEKSAETEPKTAAKVPNETDLSDEDYALLTEKQQRAVNKKHRAMKEADEFAEEQYRERRSAERRADEAEAKLRELEAKGKPAPVEAKEPDPKDFTNDKGEFDAFGYAKALAKFSAEEAVKADRETQAKAQKEAAQAQAYQEYLGRVRESAKGIENWQELAEGAVDLRVSGPLTQYLYESTDAPAPLLAHFAEHPEVLERLNALPAIKAIAAITKLELTLTKPEEPESPKGNSKGSSQSRAPEPISPLGNGAAVTKDPRDMTTKEHIDDEYRMAREASRTRKRH